MVKQLPDKEYLHLRLEYDLLTGKLTWKQKDGDSPQARWWNKRFAGKEAGSPIKSTGYREIRIDDVPYYAHRIIWKMCTGKDPAEQIDHIDLNRSNNAFSNLREASFNDNARNVPMHAGNLSGRKGVVFCPRGKRGDYRAQIMVGGKTTHLGFFDNPDDAHAVYLAEAKRRYGTFARG